MYQSGGISEKKAGNDVENGDSIYCNSCGKSIAMMNGILMEDAFEATKEWGYFSHRDMETHHFNLCEECYDKMVAEFKIPVSDDLPFDLPYLFGGSIRNKSLVYLNETPGDIGLYENSIPSIRAFARHILGFINTRTRSFTPTVVYTKEGYLILAEGETSDNMLSGSMAVFQKSGGQYLLRMIIDMK
jgi:ribosomal-protein-alanine N-acetyltransferase